MDGEERDLLASAPALVRLAITAYLRTLGWTANQSIKGFRLVLTGDAVDAIGHEARETLKRLLGVTDLEQRLRRLPEPGDERNGDHRAQLKELGAELLARSATVEEDEEAHPAYERILTSLAPDEARILRLIAIEGARAAVDVRTWRPLDKGSELIEARMTMIAQQAGLRHHNRVQAYLNNLERLGLVSFSDEAIDDLSAYQVLEAQPEVERAMARAGRGRTMRRSVRMTPFGRDFCEVCLPIDTAGFLALQDEIEADSPSPEVIKDLSIPIFTGVIGYITNWSGIWMLFNPLEFKGFRFPGLQYLAKLAPRKVQQIPGVMHGGVGWQGIIPSRAAKMGSISVDKTIAKIGSASDFYESLDPEKLADHILDTSRDDIRELVEKTMREEHPQLWRDLPPAVRQAVHDRVQAELPKIVHEVVVDRIGGNIDQLLDVKLMVIRHLEKRPELSNRMFREVGERELKFIINFGFFFGFVCGIPVIFIVHAIPHWWVLPVLGTIIGYSTNWLAISMIFEPNEPRNVFGMTWQGLFLKRRDHAAEVYASVVADEIVTVANIGDELVNGPSGDRTRALIEAALRPAVDRAGGQLAPFVRVAMGTKEYDAIKESVATGGVDYTMTPLQDEAFNEKQARKLRSLMVERMKELSNPDFAEMLRAGMREDEWLLVLHGAVLGFGAGLVHLGIFGV